MEIRTRYDLWDQLYFFHEGVIRCCSVEQIQVGQVYDGANEENSSTTPVITYLFRLSLKDKRAVSKLQSEVFKRRADLIKTLL